ncbi:uncharacterized protein PAC_16201 [Phialocephala subalpina]|uniref:Uncharacterized protein n=1 Tax=Phialocephala subalpina TaxID=576137 RepID=A0A1L7XMM4_9HELO|nr:uncharacterized protein PAC_16201 [Phialocephala subalpina]
MIQTQAAERLHQEYTGGCFYSPGYVPDSGGTTNQDQVVSAPAGGGGGELSMTTLSAIVGPIASIFVIISGVWGFFKCWRKKDKRTVHFHGDLQGATFNVSSKGVDLPPAYSS